MSPVLLFLDVSGGELLLIVFVVFLVFGPKKMPEIARKLGRMMNELKKASHEITREFQEGEHEVRKELNTLQNSIAHEVEDVQQKISEVQQETKAELARVNGEINNIPRQIQQIGESHDAAPKNENPITRFEK